MILQMKFQNKKKKILKIYIVIYYTSLHILKNILLSLTFLLDNNLQNYNKPWEATKPQTNAFTFHTPKASDRINCISSQF